MSAPAGAGSRDAVVIGAGHNGLTAACYLAGAGRRVLVLERREILGGATVTEELHPGYRFSTCASTCGPLPRRLLRDLRLEDHGLRILRFPPVLSSLLPDGEALLISGGRGAADPGISRFSRKDAERYREFLSRMERISRSLRPLLARVPPALFHPRAGNAREVFLLGGRLRWMGRRDLAFLIRILPMSLSDLLNDWFETEPLKAVLASGSLLGTLAGPASPGTASLLLLEFLAGGDGEPGQRVMPLGGMGGLSAALASAARSRGAEIRAGAEVERILVRDGAARGVVLRGGEEIPCRVVLSNADPKRTFLRLLDAGHLDPGFLHRVRNIRMHGATAVVHLAVRGLPGFPGLATPPGVNPLAGRIRIGPSLEYLERAFDDAKYGRPSGRPFMEVVIPSLTDPSLAPEGGHVVSIRVQHAPYHLREGSWKERREELGDEVVRILAEHAPDLPGSILHRRVLTPWDLEKDFALTEGHLFHGDHSMDQLFSLRPLPDSVRYGTPIRNLFLCGAGTHPGGGVRGLCGYNAARRVLREWKRGGIR